jgi:hypothetical protein
MSSYSYESTITVMETIFIFLFMRNRVLKEALR